MSEQLAVPFVIPTAIQASRPAPRPGLLARCGAWLRQLSGNLQLREMEPRLARDIGAAPPSNVCPEGYAVDPRPLWGIGLTPQPMETDPPWSAKRQRG